MNHHQDVHQELPQGFQKRIHGNELIIGVGGDGTLNEIADGFFDGEKMGKLPAAFEIIPQKMLVKGSP